MSEVEVELCPVLSSTTPASFQRTLFAGDTFLSFLSDPFAVSEEPKLPRRISSIRAIYRRMADWAASARLPRNVAQTPYEYQRVLALWLPEAGEDFAFITNHYVLVRYGDCLPSRVRGQVRTTWKN